MGKNTINTLTFDAEHRDYVTRLREALMEGPGKDRDVTAQVKPFMAYKKNGLDLTIHFATRLPSRVADWALELTKANMQETYDKSGYMWDDDDKREELTQHGGAGRFLLVRERHDEDKGKTVGFVNFRFTLQGEAVGVLGGEPALYVMDVQLEEGVRRKGLGRHLVRTLEMVARKQRMMHVMLPVTVADESAKAFFLKGMNGFIEDDLSKVSSRDGSDPAQLLAEDGTFTVISKALEAPRPAVAAPTTPQKAAPPASDADLSAANTPSKAEDAPADHVQAALAFVQQQEYKARVGKLGDNLDAMKSGAAGGAALPAFDPTFGGAAQSAPADAAGAAASKLKQELLAFGAIDEKMGGQAEAMLIELMQLFKMKNNRDPTEAEVEKWVSVVRQAVSEGAAMDQVDEESEEGSDEEGSDEEGSDEEEEEH